MKITVLGAGPIGSAIACDLTVRSEVTHVQVCDNRSGRLRALKEFIQSPKVRTVRVDARDERAITPVLAGSACVIGSSAPTLNPKLAALSLGAGAHFCDLGGDEAAVGQELALHDEAKRAGRWIVPNCGLAPGLVNVLVFYGLGRFDEVETVTMRVGNIPVEAEAPLFHRLGYGADRLVTSYTAPAPAIRDGALQTVPPLSGLEAVSFPPPFETLEAFATASKLSTLPLDLAGRVQHLDYKTLRHPGHAAAMRAVLALGFGDERSVDVQTHLSYRDLLTRRLREHLGGATHDAVLVRIRLDGRIGSEARTLTFELVDHHDPAMGFSAMQRSTSFPAAAIATLLATGAVPGGGAAPPERIVPPEPFFAALAARGLDLREQWDDGGFEPLTRSATATA